MEALEADKLFGNDIEMALDEFCTLNDIADMKKESQAVWNSALYHIRKRVFPDRKILKSDTLHTIPSDFPQQTTCNAYNYELLKEILDIYIYDLCMKYDKEVSIIGYTTLTGIDEQLIHEWSHGNAKLSSSGFEIYKKLSKFREESLSNKLATGNKNPVGILAILNRHYQWNLPGVSREQTKSALTASELPQLSGGQPEPLKISGDSE